MVQDDVKAAKHWSTESDVSFTPLIDMTRSPTDNPAVAAGESWTQTGDSHVWRRGSANGENGTFIFAG